MTKHEKKIDAIVAEALSEGEKKQRKSPIPQDAGRILAGALKLSLQERVDIVNALKDANDAELKLMEESFNKAKALLNGKQ